MSKRPVVLLLHGLWMGPPMMRVLGERLQKEGVNVHFFGYNSITQGAEHGLGALHDGYFGLYLIAQFETIQP